jgi:hypothetical protein
MKFMNKNNIAGAIFLMLVLLFSQSATFNFLLNSLLGRALLVMSVLYVSYINKYMGLVLVVFVSAMFYSNDAYYFEGMENATPQEQEQTQSDTENTNTTKIVVDASNVQVDVSANMVPPKVEPKKDETVAAEGFDILGLENSIKRGKQSNAIPVDASIRDVDYVAPFDSFSFSEYFLPF